MEPLVSGFLQDPAFKQELQERFKVSLSSISTRLLVEGICNLDQFGNSVDHFADNT